MKKFIYFIPLFFFLIFSINVSALSPTWDYLGITEEDYYFLEENGYVDFELPSLFTLDWSIDETISLSSNGVLINYYYYYVQTKTIPFGYAEVIAGTDLKYAEMILYNDGNPLFDNPGTLNLKLYLLGNNFTLTCTYGDNEVSSSLGSNSTEGYYTDVSIPNPEGKLSKVVIRSTSPTYTTDGRGPFMGYGIQQYGYQFLEPDNPDVPDVEPNVPGDTSGVFNFLLSFMADYIESLFLLEIVTDVTFGYFLLAVAILGVIFSFLFSRMIK